MLSRRTSSDTPPARRLPAHADRARDGIQIPTLRLLGDFAFEAVPGAPPVRLGRKGQAMLAYAAMQRDTGASRSRLIDLLWADHGETEARSALRQCLHLVRRELGPAAAALEGNAELLVLDRERLAVDVHRFEELAARSDLDAMVAAAELYRGDFAQELEPSGEFSRWAAGERERLRDAACGLLNRLSDCPGDTPAHEATVRLAYRLLAGDPVHEGCYRALMHLHARAGQRAKALQIGAECRSVLRRELGVGPSEQTLALIAALQRGDDATVPRAAPFVISSIDVRSGTVPRPTGDPLIFDLMLRGWQLFSLYTPGGNARAREAFEAVLARAPGHAEAMAYCGWTHWFDSIAGWTADAALSYRLASDWASRAMQCNRDGHPSPHAIMGKVLLWRMDHDAALEELRKSAALAPDAAYPQFNLADAMMWCGRCDESLSLIQRALELDPNEHGLFLTIKGKALWMNGQLREAQAALASAITRNPGYAWAHGALAVVQVERGDIEAARQSATAARRLNRRFSLSFAQRALPFLHAEHRRRQVRAWRAAGMPQEEGPWRQEPRPAPRP